MKILQCVSAICLSAISLAVAQIQPVIASADGQGNVDWSERFVIATGIGAPNPDLPPAVNRPGAIRAATMVALRNALETIKGIYLNSTTTVENFMTKSDVVTSSVSGFVKGFEIADRAVYECDKQGNCKVIQGAEFEGKGRVKYMSDGTVEVTVKVPLDGVDGLGQKLLPDLVGEKPSVSTWEGKAAKKSRVFTGLIIDCRGLKVKPCLSPKVLDEAGKEIYGSAYVSREWAVKYGMAGYSKDPQVAAKLERVGGNPGMIKALKASGDNSTDVVIADKDAAEVRSAADNLKFLSECRVVLLVD
jgi:hypothetical protein